MNCILPYLFLLGDLELFFFFRFGDLDLELLDDDLDWSLSLALWSPILSESLSLAGLVPGVE